jgi:hypothetical protein
MRWIALTLSSCVRNQAFAGESGKKKLRKFGKSIIWFKREMAGYVQEADRDSESYEASDNHEPVKRLNGLVQK